MRGLVVDGTFFEEELEIIWLENIILVQGWEAYYVEGYAFMLTYILSLLPYYSHVCGK